VQQGAPNVKQQQSSEVNEKGVFASYFSGIIS